MSFFSNFLIALRQLFAPKAKPALFYRRKPLGPAFTQVNEDTIRIDEGDLTGWEFKMTFEVTDDEAHVHLFREGKEIGHCDLQRHAHEAAIVLWNIVVQEQLRHKGLASIMARVAFRRLMELHKTGSFAIRMIRLIKPSDKITKIQNVGIGVIARKLGFTAEYNLEQLLRQRNIQLIELIRSDGVMPPGYRIVLKIFPLVLIAFLVNPENGKPYPDGHVIYNSLVTPDTAEMWAQEGRIIIGNGNYFLRKEGIEELINHIAADEFEASDYARRIRPVSV
jgi:hypothetical protein